jgi:hypothetical protein
MATRNDTTCPTGACTHRVTSRALPMTRQEFRDLFWKLSEDQRQELERAVKPLEGRSQR